MLSKKKIAFIKWKDFSHINERVHQLLQANFPTFQVDIIDLSDFINKTDLGALFYGLKEYGWDILLGKKSFKRSFRRTPYFFNKMRSTALDRLTNENYTFTFQTQSIFDASLPGIPHFVYTDHTHLANQDYPGFNPDKMFTKSWIDFEKQIYQNATINFTMSSNISKSLIEDYCCEPERVSCVYCGSNVAVTKDEVFQENRLIHKIHKNILFVGIDWQRKGGPCLVEAFRKVLVTYPDASLTILGCSPQLDIPNCKVVGRVPLTEVKKYFQQASIFCLPTTLEPFGIVFLEAMAHKLPIVASNIGAIPDFIIEGENGYLVEPNNSQQLAKKIIEILGSQEKRTRFGKYAYNLFWDRYTWEQTGISIRENIDRVLN